MGTVVLGRTADTEAVNCVNANGYQDAPPKTEKEKKEKKQTQHEMQPQGLYTDTVEDDDLLAHEYIEPDEPQ